MKKSAQNGLIKWEEMYLIKGKMTRFFSLLSLKSTNNGYGIMFGTQINLLTAYPQWHNRGGEDD